jgi:hypothetical protein
VDYITKNGLPDLISFDHDLSPDHYQHTSGDIPYDTFDVETGYHCAQWLVEHCWNNMSPFPNIMIHSMNPVGTKNIVSAFKHEIE